MAPDDPLPLRAALVRWAERALGARCAIEVGLPRRMTGAEHERPGGAGVWLRLEQALAPHRAAHLWLEASLALALVDRTLGGEALPSTSAHPAAQLHDAELGVLAYAVARACEEASSGLRLTDFGAPPAEALAGALRCAAAVHLDDARGVLHVYLPGGDEGAWLPCLPVTWVVAAETVQLDGLEPGDVVLLDPLPVGGWLRVGGLEGELPVRSTAEGFRARPGPPLPRAATRVELEVGALGLAQLAELAEESANPVPLAVAGARARLCRPDAPAWPGDLVRMAGRPGLRLD